MAKRLILFSLPTPTVWNQLERVIFPDYIPERVFAYMPSEGDAREINAQFAPMWEDFAKKFQAKLVIIDNSKRDREAQIEIEKLKSATVLLITGGNTFKLLNHLRKSGLDKAIVEFWKKDKIVLAGFSAGAIVVSPSIKTAAIYGDENTPGLTDISGLGIIDFEVWPHYEINQAQKLADYKSTCSHEVTIIGNDDVIVIDR